jgi:hypothetical protein
MDDDVGFGVKIDAAEKSQKPELVVQSNLIQGNLTSQMGQMELQEEKGGCWSTPLGRVGSSLSFFPRAVV